MLLEIYYGYIFDVFDGNGYAAKQVATQLGLEHG